MLWVAVPLHTDFTSVCDESTFLAQLHGGTLTPVPISSLYITVPMLIITLTQPNPTTVLHRNHSISCFAW